MDRPKKLSGEQGEYIEYLEGLISKYESKRTIVGSYFGLKRMVDDINSIMINGLDIEVEKVKNGETITEKINVPVVSSESLSSSQDKVIDRLLKFVGDLSKYNTQLKDMEQEFAPELKKAEAEFGGELEEIILGK